MDGVTDACRGLTFEIHLEISGVGGLYGGLRQRAFGELVHDGIGRNVASNSLFACANTREQQPGHAVAADEVHEIRFEQWSEPATERQIVDVAPLTEQFLRLFGGHAAILAKADNCLPRLRAFSIQVSISVRGAAR